MQEREREIELGEKGGRDERRDAGEGEGRGVGGFFCHGLALPPSVEKMGREGGLRADVLLHLNSRH